MSSCCNLQTHRETNIHKHVEEIKGKYETEQIIFDSWNINHSNHNKSCCIALIGTERCETRAIRQTPSFDFSDNKKLLSGENFQILSVFDLNLCPIIRGHDWEFVPLCFCFLTVKVLNDNSTWTLKGYSNQNMILVSLYRQSKGGKLKTWCLEIKWGLGLCVESTPWPIMYDTVWMKSDLLLGLHFSITFTCYVSKLLHTVRKQRRVDSPWKVFSPALDILCVLLLVDLLFLSC